MKPKLWGLFAALSFLYACEFGSAPTGTGSGGEGLTGILVDGKGTAIVNARVWVYPDTATILAKAARAWAARVDSTTTDSRGRYDFKKLPAGRYSLTASYTRQDTTYALFLSGIEYNGGREDLGADTLRAASTLWVIVRDVEEAPVAGAVCALAGTPWRVVSNANGECRFDGVAAGEHRVQVTATGRTAAESPVTVYVGQESAGCQVYLGDPGETPPTAPVPALPLDGEDSIPVANATLSWLPPAGGSGTVSRYYVEVRADTLFSYTGTFADTLPPGTTSWKAPYMEGSFGLVMLGLLDGHRYYWRVVAVGPGGAAYSPVRSFITTPRMPEVPVPMSPSNAATNVSLFPALSWTEIPDVNYAYNYLRVQVSTDSLFGVLVADNYTTASEQMGNSSVSVGPLQPATRYFWRILAVGNMEATAYSQVRSFTTQAASGAPPSIPQLETIAAQYAYTYTFAWTSNRDPGTQYYHLQIALDSLFLDPVVNDTAAMGTTNSPALDTANGRTVRSLTSDPYSGPLRIGSTYFWRVVGVGAGGFAPSAVRSFKPYLWVAKRAPTD